MELQSETFNNIVENGAVSPGILDDDVLSNITTPAPTGVTDVITLSDPLNSKEIVNISETDTFIVDETGLISGNIIKQTNSTANNQTSTSNKDTLTGTTETEINNSQKDPLINPKGKDENPSQFDYINQSLSTQNTLINQEPPTIKESQTTNTEKIQTSPETTLKTTNQTPQNNQNLKP